MLALYFVERWNHLQNKMRLSSNRLNRKTDGICHNLKLFRIDRLLDETGHIYRLTEQDFEQEAVEIERRRKQLSAQKDTLQSDYRRAMRSYETGG